MITLKTIESLNFLSDIFQSVKEVYYKKKELQVSDLESANISVDIELPILEEGVSFNTGEPTINVSKLTSNKNWDFKAKRGESEITIKVASIHVEINELFLNKQNEITNHTILGNSYNLEPKTIKGSLFLLSDDHSMVLILSNVSITSNLVIEQDNTSYFLLNIIPYQDNNENSIYILKKDKNTYIVDNNGDRLISEQNEFIITDRNE